MTLDSLGVPFRSIDVTVYENNDEREFMRQNAINPRAPDDVPLPPQIFYKEDYLGVCGVDFFFSVCIKVSPFQNYQDFDDAVEFNRFIEFTLMTLISKIKAFKYLYFL